MNPDLGFFTNSVDSDQDSEEAGWSGSTIFDM